MCSHFFFKEFEIKSSKSINSRSKHHSNSMAELALIMKIIYSMSDSGTIENSFPPQKFKYFYLKLSFC